MFVVSTHFCVPSTLSGFQSLLAQLEVCSRITHLLANVEGIPSGRFVACRLGQSAFRPCGTECACPLALARCGPRPRPRPPGLSHARQREVLLQRLQHPSRLRNLPLQRGHPPGVGVHVNDRPASNQSHGRGEAKGVEGLRVVVVARGHRRDQKRSSVPAEGLPEHPRQRSLVPPRVVRRAAVVVVVVILRGDRPDGRHRLPAPGPGGERVDAPSQSRGGPVHRRVRPGCASLGSRRVDEREPAHGGRRVPQRRGRDTRGRYRCARGRYRCAAASPTREPGEDQPDDDVRPAPRRTRPPTRRLRQEPLELFPGSDGAGGESVHAPVFGNLQVVIAPVVLVALGADRREQVPRELAVNLKRAHLDPDLRAGAAAPDDGARALALDSGEQVRAYPRDEARIVVESDVVDPASVVPASVVAPEGVRLASARLSVRHDPDVVSIPRRSQGGLAYRRVNLLLSLVELPRVIEGEVLGVPRPRVAARHPVAPRDVEAPPRSQVALDARHRAHAHGYAGVADHLPITSGERHDDSASPDAPLLVRSTPRMGKFSNAGRNANRLARRWDQSG